MRMMPSKQSRMLYHENYYCQTLKNGLSETYIVEGMHEGFVQGV